MDKGSDNTINSTQPQSSGGESESDQEWVAVPGSEVPLESTQAPDPSPKRKRRTKDDFSEHGFQIFWQAYPKRVGVSQAYDYWCNKMDPATRCAAAEGVEKFITGKEVKYLPDPIRYLKHKRWMDEAVPEPEQDVQQDPWGM